MENSSRPIVEKQVTSKKVLITSFVVDILDVILNFAIALISGSIIMTTQVLEGFSDLASSGFLMLGYFRSEKKEDRIHPFGYGREIYFWSLLSALIMFGLTSTLSFYLGWQRFNNPERIEDVNFALLILGITFFTNGYAFFLSLTRLLRRRPLKHVFKIFYKSSLVETKTTFILDLMGASASFIGMIALLIYVFTGDLRFDGLGAMVIGIVLAIFSIFLILGIRDLMIGRSASKETEKKIIKAALEIDGVEDVLEVKTLHLGTEKLLVNLFVHMKSRLSTRKLEDLIDKIEDRIRIEVPSVKYVQVELENHKDH
jgi:cation diffusion facilitator family transporter